LDLQLSWVAGVGETVLMAFNMELDEMWVEFEAPADGLEGVPTWSKSLIWELWKTSGNKLVHSRDH
jgi:hypothetical protein